MLSSNTCLDSLFDLTTVRFQFLTQVHDKDLIWCIGTYLCQGAVDVHKVAADLGQLVRAVGCQLAALSLMAASVIVGKAED